MQIQAINEKQAGKRILCNGVIYVVAPGGALCKEGETEPADVDSATADKLLQNVRTWEPYGAPRGRGPQQRPPGARVQLIDRHGQVVDTGELEPKATAETPTPATELEHHEPPAGPILKSESAQSPPVAEPAQPQECSPSPGDTGEGSAPPSPESEDPPIPSSEGEEWADPKPIYSVKWLRLCAKAYDLKVGPRASPETLCERITAAMYGGDDQEQST